MRTPILFFIFVFLGALSFSQVTRAKNWYFGTNNRLSFAGGSPTTVSGGQLTNTLGCAVISDLSGNVLFYTDGVTVYNSNNSVMANGTGLDGSGASQPAIILKQPGNTNVYYLFTVGGFSTTNGLKYSVVDMSMAAGLGSVTAKNILLDNNCRDKLTAGKHCNGNDLWVVSTTTNSNNFFNYSSALLTNTGVAMAAAGTLTFLPQPNQIGQMKISPNSRKFGLTCYYGPVMSFGSIYRFIADFDNATGQIALTNTIAPYVYFQGGSLFQMCYTHGLEFSPNSNYMYSNFYLQALYRFGLCDSSEYAVPLQESTNQFDFNNKRQYQLGPDGKIYVATNGTNAIGAINNPNSASPTYTQIGVSLGTNTCQWGLPNFPGFYFEQKPPLAFTYTSNVSCMTASFSTISPCERSGYVVNGYNWDFGDVSSGTNNISFLQNPFHTFTSAGTYTVRLIRYMLCNTADTTIQTVNITQPALSINSSTNCYGTTCTVQVTGGVGPYSYLWSANSQSASVANFTTVGIYSVTVTDQGAGGCQRTATVAVMVPTVNVNIFVNPSMICAGTTTGQANVNVSGGSGNYMYTYAQNTQSSSVLNNLVAGIHTLTVTDFGFNCVITKTFFIATSAQINVPAIALPPQNCEGGSITLYSGANGGTGPLSYTWFPGNANTYSILVTAAAGNYVYTISVSDSLGCSNTNTIGFNFNAKPIVAVANASACFGTSTVLTASGAITYTWMPGNLTGSMITPTANASLVYSITGASNLNCLNTTTAMLTVLPLPAVSASCTSPICEGQTVNFSGSSANTYMWSGPNNFSSLQQNPSLINVQLNNAGIYTLTVTNANSCKNKTIVSLVLNALPVLNLLSSYTNVCLGQQINVLASGANTYTWMNGSNQNPINFSPTTSTIIQVSGTDTLSSCVGTATLLINVKNCNPAGIAQEDMEQNQFPIFPNPNQGEFSIQSPGTARFSIVDALGRKILEGELKVGLNPLKISASIKGTYILNLYYQDQNLVQKLVVE